ncbi:DNA polymerase III subunit beta [Catenulispora subtropica]|uniref:DNA polymerase III subunit beta n=1 Tax=Catenulispora subtropica TaxID=450798 RepID=A0ABN2T1W9_9ACTN
MNRTKAKAAAPIPDLHLECDRTALLAALVAATSALPARPASPVLAGVRLDAADRELVVSSFDYDVSTRIRMDASVLSAGTVLLEGKRLHDLLKKSRGESVRISTAGAKAIVEPGPSRFELGTLPIAKYPALPDLPKPGGTVFVQQFLGAVRKVLLASGPGPMSMLAGVRLEFGPDTLTLAATDRYRLTVAEIPWFPDDPEAEHAPILVPASILKTIAARWKAATGRTRIGNGSAETVGVVGFAHGAESCTARLLVGEFVKFRTLFAPDYPLGVVVETAPLKAATELITLVADGTAPVELAFAPGEVVVATGGGDAAHGSESVPALYDGPPFSMSFNPGHLLDWLGASGRGFVRIAIARPSKPVVLTGHDTPVATDDDGVRYLMMPKTAAGLTANPDPPLPDYLSGRPMLPWHVTEYVAELGDGCQVRALRQARTSRKDIAAALEQLANPLYPGGVADRPGAVLLRNLAVEADVFARWAKGAKGASPACRAGCAHDSGRKR